MMGFDWRLSFTKKISRGFLGKGRAGALVETQCIASLQNKYRISPAWRRDWDYGAR
jgi:hypothetical protein